MKSRNEREGKYQGRKSGKHYRGYTSSYCYEVASTRKQRKEYKILIKNAGDI